MDGEYMSEIHHDISINAVPETVYQALTTAQGLKAWFTSQVSGSGELGSNWKLSFADQLFFSWEVLTAENPHRVVWECLDGPGNSIGTEVEFLLKPGANNQTILTIFHRGWKDRDPKFTRCVEIWRTLMSHLQRYCETGVAEPAYR